MSSELKVQVLQSVQQLNQGKIGQSRMARVQTGSQVSEPHTVETDRAASVNTKSASPSPAELETGNKLPSSGELIPPNSTNKNANNNAGPSLPQQNSQNPSNDEVLGAVQELNDFVQNARREIHFSVDDQTGRTVVKVIDHQTKDVIRQIPADEILEVARRMKELNDDKGNLLQMQV